MHHEHGNGVELSGALPVGKNRVATNRIGNCEMTQTKGHTVGHRLALQWVVSVCLEDTRTGLEKGAPPVVQLLRCIYVGRINPSTGLNEDSSSESVTREILKRPYHLRGKIDAPQPRTPMRARVRCDAEAPVRPVPNLLPRQT